MNQNLILFIGALISIGLAVLWYFDIVSEPAVAIFSGVLTAVGYFLASRKPDDPASVSGDKNVINYKSKIKNQHNY